MMGAAPLDQSELVERIYECAACPELWPEVLEHLAGLAGARGGLLFANYASPAFVWTASRPVQDDYARFFSDRPFALSTERVPRLFKAGHAGFMRDHDIYTEEELARDPMYRDFLWPIGLGWSTGTAIDLPTGNRIVISLEREHELGPVDAKVVRHLDTLRPHLARSAFLATRLSLTRAQAAAEALAAVGLPALVLDDAGKVLVANELIEGLRDAVHWRAGDRIALQDRSANALLHEALATPVGAPEPVRSFAVRKVGGEANLVAHLVPLTRTARDFVSCCAAILVLTPVGVAAAPPAELIRSLFDLTPTEAHIARGIARGETIADMAEARSVSRETVRTHVGNVLEKTGCKRQSEAALLLGGVGLRRHSPS